MTVKARKFPTLGVLVLAVVSLTGFVVTASAASAASPWWHLTSGSRPTDLQAGLAKDEVQRLTVNANGGVFLLESKKTPVAFLPFNASAENLQVALEGIYGQVTWKCPKGKVTRRAVNRTRSSSREGRQIARSD